jgi:hypothetical protein
VAGQITIERATLAETDLLVEIHDDAARWLWSRGIRQWEPGTFPRDWLIGCIERAEASLVTLLGDYATIAREEQSDDPSWTWYIIAEVENGNRLSIDFGLTHNGRCYDSFWDIYGQVGNMPVIAASLTELLQQLYTHKGERWYWLEPGCQVLGDAHVAT